MDPQLRVQIIAGLKDGSIVPYLGPGVLSDVVSTTTGAPMPATSDQLILAMNGGKPMSPKLMYEFSRAAMNVELKRGRTAVTRFLDTTYGATRWTRSAVHDWLREIRPPCVIDINRDTQLLDSYATTPHTLILGCARIVANGYRFRLFAHDGEKYVEIGPEQVDTALPVLFKTNGRTPAGIELHRLGCRLRRLHHRADGRLRYPRLHQDAPSQQTLPAAWNAPEPRHGTHGALGPDLRRPHHPRAGR